MTKQELLAFITSKHNPALAEREGMVSQVWEDGEHTCQKSGRLLWQRTLHCFASGIEGFSLAPSDMPVKDSPTHGYAFVTSEDALAIREAMREYMADNP